MEKEEKRADQENDTEEQSTERDTVFSFTSSCINLFLSMVFQQTVFLCSYPDTAVQNKVEC